MPNNNGNHSPQPAERRGRIGGTSWHHFAQLTFPLRRNGTECAAEAGQAGEGLWRVPGGALAGGMTEAAPPRAVGLGLPGRHHYPYCRALHGAIQRAAHAGMILISPQERSGSAAHGAGKGGGVAPGPPGPAA